MASPRFAIDRIVDDIGETVTVVGITRAYDNRGDLSGATYVYNTDTAVVQQMTADDVEVQEGILKPEDMIAYFKDTTSLSGSLVIGNQISGSYFSTASQTYDIKEVIHNLGHFEVHAAKL